MNEYDKYVAGLIIVRSNDGLFNADFTGRPRTLPDGTFYATDKALKYCIRNYLKTKDRVFVWRRRDEENEPLDLDECYEKEFGKIEKKTSKAKILENLLKCIDVRLFGITYAGTRNVSLTGPVQISYGIDKFDEQESPYRSQIQSPYRRLGGEEGTEKEKPGAETLGDEWRVPEVHYVYDFTINPNCINDAVKDLEGNFKKLTSDDIGKFKEAARKSVSSLNSTTMIGSENEMLLFLEHEKPTLLQNLKDFVKVNKSSDERVIDLSALQEYLNGVFPDEKPEIELFYDSYKTKIQGFEENPDNVRRIHILTDKDLECSDD